MASIQTPWGVSQTQTSFGDGITCHDTASHGGFHVEAAQNKLIPAYMRRAGGFYEEDCEWSIVATVFPAGFTAGNLACAKSTFRNWYPEAYEKFYGVTLAPGESHVRDEQVFKTLHALDYLVLSAFGDWHPKVAKGNVGVFAGIGGRTERGGFPDDVKWFSVPKSEYDPEMFILPGQYPEMEAIQ